MTLPPHDSFISTGGEGRWGVGWGKGLFSDTPRLAQFSHTCCRYASLLFVSSVCLYLLAASKANRVPLISITNLTIRGMQATKHTNTQIEKLLKQQLETYQELHLLSSKLVHFLNLSMHAHTHLHRCNLKPSS